jgi:dTDP-4-dehydrorhamnose reductase
MGEKIMKKILIIGSRGMAGHMIKEYFSQKEYDVYGTFKTIDENRMINNEFHLDAFNNNELNQILEKINPNFVINCIGILNQFAEENPDVAIYVNGYFPHYLDRLSIKYKYKLIHITTDCVFSGEKGNYKEDDFRDANSYYGRTKAIGEVNNDRTLTFRTSIIGPDINKDGIGLFNWFMKQENKINGYSNVFWTGVTTLELAKAIEASFNQNITGIIHLVNNEKLSKYNLLKLFSKYMNKNIEIKKYKDYYSDKSLIKTKEDFKYIVPNYEKMIEELALWILKKNKFYY